MQSAVNYLRGRVRLTAWGAFPERLLNLCAQRSVTFWAVEWQDSQTLRMSVLRRDRARLEELAQRAGCTLREEEEDGLPAFLIRFRRRYAFLLGLALSAAAICLLSNVVLTVEVTGNEAVPQAVILSQLRQLGLRPGVYGPNLDTKQIALDAQLALEELSWVSINRYGTRVQVVVREKVMPPALLEEDGVSDVRARAGGLILRTDVLAGQAKVKAGDMVAPGELLISGTVTMEGPQYSDIAPSYLYVRAEGAVWARTWRTVSACIPLTAQVKDYTGAEISRWALTLFDRRINFYGNGSISWDSYDKISKIHSAVLPGGQRLPLSLTREVLRQWQPRRVEVETGAAQDLLERQLYARLEQLVGEEGRVVTVDWSARIEGGLLTVTGTAECEEQIGQTAPAEKSGGERTAG